jgi:hypothetical protein
MTNWTQPWRFQPASIMKNFRTLPSFAIDSYRLAFHGQQDRYIYMLYFSLGFNTRVSMTACISHVISSLVHGPPPLPPTPRKFLGKRFILQLLLGWCMFDAYVRGFLFGSQGLANISLLTLHRYQLIPALPYFSAMGLINLTLTSRHHSHSLKPSSRTPWAICNRTLACFYFKGPYMRVQPVLGYIESDSRY